MNTVWGLAADRWGVKAGLVRSLCFAIVGLLIVGLARAPEHALVGRLVQALGGGANAAAIALASATLPSAQLGLGMGLLLTGQSLGGALGPVVGGLIGDALGFRYAFLAAAALSALMALAAVALLREPPARSRPVQGEGLFASLGYVFGSPVLRGLIIVQFLFQVGYIAVWSFIPLRVQEISPDPESVGSWSGATLMADALGIALGASLLGWLSPRLGPRRVMAIASVVAAVATAALVPVHHLPMLVALRFVAGLCVGGVLPVARAQLGVHASPGRRGVTFGISQSAFAGGWSMGSFVGSAAIGLAGLPGTFVASAAIMALTAAWTLVATPAPREGSRESSGLRLPPTLPGRRSRRTAPGARRPSRSG